MGCNQNNQRKNYHFVVQLVEFYIYDLKIFFLKLIIENNLKYKKIIIFLIFGNLYRNLEKKYSILLKQGSSILNIIY